MKFSTTESFQKLLSVIHRLRQPGGCVWDRAQTHASLKKYLLEESYELADVLEQLKDQRMLSIPRVRSELIEELGDVLFNLLLHCEIAEEGEYFTIEDVLDGLYDKLVHRHPHVFGDVIANNVLEAEKTWETQKTKENKGYLLDGLPAGMPALIKAQRIIKRVTTVGFQWKDFSASLHKVMEEIAELNLELKAYEALLSNDQSASEDEKNHLHKRISEELGDVLFACVNLSSFFSIDIDQSLSQTNTRFKKRFHFIEQVAQLADKKVQDLTYEEQHALWGEAKLFEKIKQFGLIGGIGAGKSEVRKGFADKGFFCCDADQLAREVFEGNAKVRELVWEYFGTLDRKQIRKRVFADSDSRSFIEKLMHPEIAKLYFAKVRSIIGLYDVVIYEGSLLFESDMSKRLDGFICVDADEDIRLRRITQRDQCSTQEARNIMLQQTPQDLLRSASLFVINNHNELSDLQTQIEECIIFLKKS